MTDDAGLDLGLHDRLLSLAAAAPVKPMPALATVPVVRVQRRPNALASLVPILAVIVVGTVAASLVRIGPFATGSSEPNGGVSATTRSGDFALTLTSTKPRYANDEPIEITASLRYDGSGPSAQIAHAQGARGTALGFGIKEPVIGDLVLSQGWDLSCEHTTLNRDEPLTVRFQKSAGWSMDDPRATEYDRYVNDPVLRLGSGTWHTYVVAEFSIGECGGDRVELRTEIAITVHDSTPADATPKPSAEGETAEIRPESTVTSGDFEFTLKAAKPTFSTAENIDVVGLLTYNGLKNHITIRRAVWGPVGFVVPGLPHGIQTQYFSAPLACIDMTVKRGVPFVVPLQDVSSGLPVDFRLPPGRWAVMSGASFNLDPDCNDAGVDLDASIAFDVADDGPQSSPAPAGELDVDSDASFELRLQSDKSAYFSDEPIDVKAAVAYLGSDPASYSDSLSIGGVQTDGNNRANEVCCRPLSCRSGPTGELPVEVTFTNGLDAEGPDAVWMNAFRGLPTLHLAPARWRLTATLDAEIPGCTPDATQTHLTVSIYITVVDRDLIDPETGQCVPPLAEPCL